MAQNQHKTTKRAKIITIHKIYDAALPHIQNANAVFLHTPDEARNPNSQNERNIKRMDQAVKILKKNIQTALGSNFCINILYIL